MTYFSQINKQVKRTSYPLPHIKNMVNKPSHFTYSETLYLIMGYYNIFLIDASMKICRITTLFWKYTYNRLLIGFCIAPYTFQELLSALMDDLELSEFMSAVLSSLHRVALSQGGVCYEDTPIFWYQINDWWVQVFSTQSKILGMSYYTREYQNWPQKSKQLSILNALRIKTRKAVLRYGKILPLLMANA